MTGGEFGLSGERRREKAQQITTPKPKRVMGKA
jgi:hypothetical protein